MYLVSINIHWNFDVPVYVGEVRLMFVTKYTAQCLLRCCGILNFQRKTLNAPPILACFSDKMGTGLSRSKSLSYEHFRSLSPGQSGCYDC